MTHPCPVGPARRAWIEARWAWLQSELELRDLQAVEAQVPGSPELFADYDGTPAALAGLLARMQQAVGLAEVELRLEVFPDGREGAESWSGAAGHFRVEDGVPVVAVGEAQLGDPLGLVATLVHELAHVRLIHLGPMSGDEPDHEPLTDLLCVLWGFGAYSANAAFRERNEHYSYSLSTLGYLRVEDFAYALALFVRARGEAGSVWMRALSTDVATFLRESTRFLDARGPSSEPSRAYDSLWERAATELPTPRSRGGALLAKIFAIPLSLCLLFTLIYALVVGWTRRVHLVNATRRPANVQLTRGDWTQRRTLEPLERTSLVVGEGPLSLEITSGELPPRRLEVELATGWLERLQGGVVFVVNVGGAGLLVDREFQYGGAPDPRQPLRWEHRFGREFERFEGIDDLFLAPDSVRRAGRRRCLLWVRDHPEGALRWLRDVQVPAGIVAAYQRATAGQLDDAPR